MHAHVFLNTFSNKLHGCFLTLLNTQIHFKILCILYNIQSDKSIVYVKFIYLSSILNNTLANILHKHWKKCLITFHIAHVFTTISF